MTTGLAVFDTSLGETNEWLKAIEQRLTPCTRQQAYACLRAGLHALRDRLPVEAVTAMSAQLPMLLRGLFLEGWRPDKEHAHDRKAATLLKAIEKTAVRVAHRDANEIVCAVFAVISDRLDDGLVGKLIQHLPHELREFWPYPHIAQ